MLSGHKHVPYVWRLEDLFVVNAGTVSSLRLRGNTRPCYNVIEIADRKSTSGDDIRFTARYSSSRSPRHARVREVHGRDRGRGHRAYVRAARDRRRRALLTRRSRRARGIAIRLRRRRSRRRHGEAPRRRGLRRPARRRRRGRARELRARSVVVDLSDEPVLGPVERFALASRVLAAGAVRRRGLPARPARVRAVRPAVDRRRRNRKRVGKTAVTGHVARLLSATRCRRRRDGPRRAGRAGGRHRAADRRRSRRALARRAPRCVRPSRDRRARGVETVGCRRCGGGLAGGVCDSNVARGAGVAEASTRPRRLRRERRSDPADRGRPDGRRRRRPSGPSVAAGYLNAYRLLLADLVVVTMAETASGWEPCAAVRAVVRPGVPSSRPSCARARSST